MTNDRLERIRDNYKWMVEYPKLSQAAHIPLMVEELGLLLAEVERLTAERDEARIDVLKSVPCN